MIFNVLLIVGLFTLVIMLGSICNQLLRIGNVLESESFRFIQLMLDWKNMFKQININVRHKEEI